MLRIIPVIAVCGGILFASETAFTEDHPSQDEIFNTGTVWDVHLTFAPDRWEAMQPKQEQPQSRDRSRGFLVGPEGGRNGIAAAFGWQFPQVRADLQFGHLEFEAVAVRFRGNGTFFSSRDSLKRSLKIDFNDFVKGQKLAGMSQINLHNSVREPSHMNEAIAYELYRDAGVPAPRTSFARVYVTVPGKHDRHYFGLYNLVEDVGGSFLKTNFEPSNGALLKPVTPNLFGFLGEDWSDYSARQQVFGYTSGMTARWGHRAASGNEAVFLDEAVGRVPHPTAPSHGSFFENLMTGCPGKRLSVN